MGGAEQGGAGGGEDDQVVLARGAGRRLLGRLGDPRGQRGPRDGVDEFRQPGGLGRLRAQQSADERGVEGVDGRQGLVEPREGFREQVDAHHATALVGGNHCISGSGAVVGASSR